MSFFCPNCKSENTRKLSIIFASGTSDVALASVGAGVSSGHHVGIAVASTSGKTQSLLAKQYAPPTKLSELAISGLRVLSIFLFIFLFVLCAWFINEVIGLSDNVLDNNVGTGFAALISGAVALVFFWIIIGMSDKKFASEYPVWKKRMENNFLCLRCGNEFEPILP
jgi:hypothetical protein